MQFQFSVCMYGRCGRIDNKADFDFDDGLVILVIHDGTMLPESNSWIWNVTFY